MDCLKHTILPAPRHVLNILFFIMLLGSFDTIVAQEEFIPPPSKLLTSFSFRVLTGGIITVRARVGNYPDTLTFIFDTGSGGISLDSATCTALKIPTELSDKTIRGIGGIRKVSFVYNQTLFLPGLATDSLNFHVSDYGILTSV